MIIPNPSMFDDWKDWATAVKQELEKPAVYAPRESVGKLGIFISTVGPGYLLCNGSAFLATTYPALSQFLGSNVLPNLTSPLGLVGIKT